MADTKKTCTKCGRTLPLADFYRDRSRGHKDGYTTRCKSCIAQARRTHRKDQHQRAISGYYTYGGVVYHRCWKCWRLCECTRQKATANNQETSLWHTIICPVHGRISYTHEEVMRGELRDYDEEIALTRRPLLRPRDGDVVASHLPGGSGRSVEEAKA